MRGIAAIPARSPGLLALALAAIARQIKPEILEADARLMPLRRAACQADRLEASVRAVAQNPGPQDAGLIGLASELDLSALELLSAALAAAVERDAEIAQAIATVQEPFGGARPTIGLAMQAFAELDASGDAVSKLADGAAVTSGLLVLGEGSGPLPQRTLSMPAPLVAALHAGPRQAANWPGAVCGIEEAARVPLAPSEIERTRRQARALVNSGETCAVIRAASLLEARSAAAVFAETLGRRPAFLTAAPAPGFGPWLLLCGMLPVHALPLGPGERRVFPAIAGYRGPALALLELDGELATESGLALIWTLGVPPAEEREALWRRHVADAALARRLAAGYRFRPGRIFDLGRLARHHAALEDRTTIEQRDIEFANRSGEATGLSSVAQRVDADVPDEALIVPPPLRRELELLCFRCRARERLADGLGASLCVRYRPGVQALFAGPSGTGKTLAALWLASRLALALYRVDLAAVTSKYIGETEKNLSHLLTCAEQAGVILLFDEADSLFGRRTDIQDANDRFANAQTNYLLQRMENFDGIAILTSNSRARLDASFTRRLETILEFPLPDPMQRRALWEAHLGSHHRLSPADLNLVAVAGDLAGGDIRNVVLCAALLAKGRGEAIEMSDVLAGVQSEYRKLGRALPEPLQRPAAKAN